MILLAELQVQMKILHTVEFYHPSIGGSQEVVRQISEKLVKRGHEVTVATSGMPDRKADVINGVKIEEFAVAGKAAKGITGETERYIEFVKSNNFDVMMNYAAQQWATDLLLPHLDKISMKKVLVPLGFPGLDLPEFRHYFDQMKDWIKQYDACVFPSNKLRDIEFARSVGVEKIVVIPNAADAEEFGRESVTDIRARLGIPKNSFLVLLVGSHTGLKGHKQAIRIFVEADISNSTLLIVANPVKNGCQDSCRVLRLRANLSPNSLLRGKKVVITPLPRAETVAAFQAADLFLFPSNTECSPIVLLEAMASRTPFLTTDVGNAREIAEWSGAGEVLPTTRAADGRAVAAVKGSARMLEMLALDGERRNEMAERGYQRWKASFTWDVVSKMYEQLYEDLLKGT